MRLGAAFWIQRRDWPALGMDRGLTVGGPPREVAAYLDRYRQIGVGEVMFVFREPFDDETIERIGEIRAEMRLLAI